METICEGEPARTIKCPHQNVVSTVWAMFGRQHPDTCVEGDQLINVTCNADYDQVISMVQESCDDSNQCDLEANKDEYGDPPECQGAKKYLQMYYLCKSGMALPSNIFPFFHFRVHAVANTVTRCRFFFFFFFFFFYAGCCRRGRQGCAISLALGVVFFYCAISLAPTWNHVQY